MRPAEIPTHETVRFLTSALPPAPARVLEVGCGRGEVAAELARRGFAVTAIDASVDAVAAARENGVAAIHADIASFEAPPFAAVVFARSLHHVRPLDAALAKARALLAPGGALIVEDFAVEAMDATTALWFYDACALLEAAGALGVDHEHRGRAEADPLARWRAEHEGEPLHEGNAMRAAIAGAFQAVNAEIAPDLYRTICAGVESSGRGVRAAEKFLALEKDRVARGLIRGVGLRVTARA